MTLEEAITKAKEIHGNKYDYSLITDYKNNKTKYPIICHHKDKNGNEHGIFWMDFSHHTNRPQGCPKCGIEKLSKMFLMKPCEFLSKTNTIHNGKYKYPKIDEELNGSTSKITIVCPFHGEFIQTAKNHLHGQGCQKCAKNEPYTNANVIPRFRKIHGDKYDYSKIRVNRYNGKIVIVCPIHGEFLQTCGGHMSGNGCPKCANHEIRKQSSIIKQCKNIHGDYYGYEKVEYKGRKHKIIVVCPIHGDFKITPDNHLCSKGCPECNRSHLETEIKNLLIDNNVTFIPQANNKRFRWLQRLSLDFYLPDYNIAIECQGGQHFMPIRLFGGEDGYKALIERDKRKYDLCVKNGVHLIYFAKNKPNSFYEDKIILFDKNKLLETIYSHKIKETQ